MHKIINGDCLEVMKTFTDNHFSAIVCDPPYGLGFMGKHWDAGLPHDKIWKEALRIIKPGGHLLAFGGSRTYHRLTCSVEDAGFEIRDCLLWLYGSGFPKSHNNFGLEGFGTALKPAYEPCIMAMKPCEGTFAQNVKKWGLGGINIDGCRIGTEIHTYCPGLTDNKNLNDDGWNKIGKKAKQKQVIGRWPANILFDEEAAEQLDEQSNQTSRFFYCAKTSKKERNEGCNGNHHPTVKPQALMRYLIKLVTPPTGALILDPFAGSGSTIIAAKQLGVNAIGIEKEHEYCEIAKARLSAIKTATKISQLDLFQN